MSEAEQPTTQPNGKRGTAPKDWPNTIAAAVHTGLTRKQLDKLVARGALRCEKDSAGVWRWDPDLLGIVAEARGDDDDDGEDGAPSPRATLTAEAVTLLRQAHGHQEQTLRLVVDPMQKLLERALDDNAALRKRVSELEARQDALIEAREKLLSEQHLRDLLTQDTQQAAARKDKALAMVKEFAPKLLASVNPAASAVVDLLRSLTDEQRAMLLETDLLHEDQKAHVRAALAQPVLVGVAQPPPAPQEGAPPA